MYNISCSSNPSYIYINSAHLCFLQAQPYIFTKVNSQSRPAIPTMTSTWSSTTSSASPSLCPHVLPVWVPVVVGLGCFLGGLVISLKILCSYWCHKYKSGQEVEMRGMKFWFRRWFYSYNSVNLHLSEFSDPTILMSAKLINFNLCKNWCINIWWNNPK